jgi:transposase
MAYPTILRERALEALRKGHTKKEVNEMFGLGKNTLKSWEELNKETGAFEKRPLNRKPSKIDRKALYQLAIYISPTIQPKPVKDCIRCASISSIAGGLVGS